MLLLEVVAAEEPEGYNFFLIFMTVAVTDPHLLLSPLAHQTLSPCVWSAHPSHPGSPESRRPSESYQQISGTLVRLGRYHYAQRVTPSAVVGSGHATAY